jgi:hypothetical protein
MLWIFRFLPVAAGFLLFTPVVHAQQHHHDAEHTPAGFLPKVHHAEPLYIDLIRDLGARKGEKEWNVGLGLTDNLRYDAYTTLVEYEWAPVNRLGLEVELPFTFYYPLEKDQSADVPASKLNGLKTAVQYTFLVSTRTQTSLALGYLNELEMPEFRAFSVRPVGNVYNPFVVAAQRLGARWHSLVYAGPIVRQHFGNPELHTVWQWNTSFHYMLEGTRNFIGVEFNKAAGYGDFDLTIRPQMRLCLAENVLVGIVAGIPVSRENERFSTFFRLIYEPKRR